MDVSLEGPWLKAFIMELDSKVMSKSNARRGAKGSKSAAAHTINKIYEARLKSQARDALPEGWDLGEASQKVLQRPKVVSFLAANTLLDASNTTKSLMDAFEGVVYINDASVVAPLPMVLSRDKAPDTYGAIAFAQLSPTASHVEVLQAVYELGKRVLSYLEKREDAA